MICVKKISAVLICAVLLFGVPLLSSCEKESEAGVLDSVYTAKEVADAIMAAYGPEEFPEGGFEHLFSGADEDSNSYIEPKYAGLIIDGGYSPLEEYEYFSDCAFYVPVGQHMFEVDVMKVDESRQKDIGILKEVLERRLKTKTNSDVLAYTPEDAPILENAKIITSGAYVILLATTDNSKAEKAINEMAAKK